MKLDGQGAKLIDKTVALDLDSYLSIAENQLKK